MSINRPRGYLEVLCSIPFGFGASLISWQTHGNGVLCAGLDVVGTVLLIVGITKFIRERRDLRGHDTMRRQYDELRASKNHGFTLYDSGNRIGWNCDCGSGYSGDKDSPWRTDPYLDWCEHAGVQPDRGGFWTLSDSEFDAELSQAWEKGARAERRWWLAFNKDEDPTDPVNPFRTDGELSSSPRHSYRGVT